VSRRISRDGFVEDQDPLAHRARQPRVRFPGFMATHAARRNRGRKWDHLRNAEPVIVATIPAGTTSTTTATTATASSRPALWAAATAAMSRTTGAASATAPTTSASGLRATAAAGTTPFSPSGAPASPTWNDFIQSSTYGRGGSARSWGVHDPYILGKLQPDFDKPVQMDMTASGRKIPRIHKLRRLSHNIFFHSWSPFLIRAVAVMFSVVSLALAARIFGLAQPSRAVPARGDLDQDAEVARSQALFVIVLDVLLIPYIGYMLVDEYKGKPLGLRSTVQKTWLILADVLFIILGAAAAALVVGSLVLNRNDDAWWDHFGGEFGALAGFLVLSLVVWTTTLIVNVFRMVERLGGSRGAGIMGSDDWEHRYMREYMV
jgi:hypothetical protein